MHVKRSHSNLGEWIFRLVGCSGVLVPVGIRVRVKTQPHPTPDSNPNPGPNPQPKRAKTRLRRVCIEPGYFSVTDDVFKVQTTQRISQVKNIRKYPFFQIAKPTQY